MEFTGERMIPEHNKGREIYLEHITRYNFANQFIKNKVVLDIACGSGYGSDMIAQNGAALVYGVDISEEAISYCNENFKSENLEFKIGSIDKIPLDDNSVDVIISFETLEHVNEDIQKKFIIEINRVLKKDGILVISTPNALVSPAGNEYHLKELTSVEFQNYLEPHFESVQICYQGDIQASYIFSSDSINNTNLNKEKLQIKKLANYKNEESYFLIAICNKKKSSIEITEEICLFNDEERKAFLKVISAKDDIIASSEKLVIERDNLIKEICLFNDEERKAFLKVISAKDDIIASSEKLVIERDNLIKELGAKNITTQSD